MASIFYFLSLALYFALLLLPNPTFSAEPPQSPYPSPSPQLPPQAISPPPASPAPSPAFRASPPAPPQSRLAPDSPSPTPSPAEYDDGASVQPKNSPPPPSVVSDDGDAGESHLGDDDLNRRDESDSMSGGKKAGIAIGVIAAACAVGLGAVVYKKRQRNIRRSRYSYTDRRDFL